MSWHFEYNSKEYLRDEIDRAYREIDFQQGLVDECSEKIDRLYEEMRQLDSRSARQERTQIYAQIDELKAERRQRIGAIHDQRELISQLKEGFRKSPF